MATMILPKDELKRLIRMRRRRGIDRFDEVWDGVYVMSPIANNDHQWISFRLADALLDAMRGIDEARILPGANVTDQVENWTKNYRCPDVVVFLPGNPAVDRETHRLGGPDFAIEVVSPGDRSRKTFPFYASVGVRELLLVERRPWRLELYRASDGKLELAGTSRTGASEILKSDVLPISMRLVAGSPRPRIEVTQTARGESWLI